MGLVIKMNDYRVCTEKVIELKGHDTTLLGYVDPSRQRLDLVVVDDEGENRTVELDEGGIEQLRALLNSLLKVAT